MGLRQGFEPDYRNFGTAVAYLFKYMPHRVCTAAAALRLYTRHSNRIPRRVLDIGSGTDAVRLALDLSLFDPVSQSGNLSTMNLIAIERSEAMRKIAALVDCGPTFEDAQLMRSPGEFDFRRCVLEVSGAAAFSADFDLIILSALFPYRMPPHDMYWNRLATQVAARMSVGSAIIAIEPQAKAALLKKLERGLAGIQRFEFHQYYQLGRPPRFNHYELGSIVRPQRLKYLNRLLERYYDHVVESRFLRDGWALVDNMRRYGIDSFNGSRSEAILLAFSSDDAPPPSLPQHNHSSCD